jgi:hypothetical protein
MKSIGVILFLWGLTLLSYGETETSFFNLGEKKVPSLSQMDLKKQKFPEIRKKDPQVEAEEEAPSEEEYEMVEVEEVSHSSENEEEEPKNVPAQMPQKTQAKEKPLPPIPTIQRVEEMRVPSQETHQSSVSDPQKKIAFQFDPEVPKVQGKEPVSTSEKDAKEMNDLYMEQKRAEDTLKLKETEKKMLQVEYERTKMEYDMYKWKKEMDLNEEAEQNFQNPVAPHEEDEKPKKALKIKKDPIKGIEVMGISFIGAQKIATLNVSGKVRRGKQGDRISSELTVKEITEKCVYLLHDDGSEFKIWFLNSL